MKLTKEHFGAILFPLLASGYATFSLWEHLTEDYRDLTVNYGLVINVPILILSAIAIARFIFVEGALEEKTSIDSTQTTSDNNHPIKPIGLIALSALLVVSIDWIGYLIGFFVFTVLGLYLMGIRRHVLILSMAIVTTILIHFIFVQILQLQLPSGPFPSLVE
jgi:hypothetical protein